MKWMKIWKLSNTYPQCPLPTAHQVTSICAGHVAQATGKQKWQKYQTSKCINTSHGRPIIFLPCGFYLTFFLLFFPRLMLAVAEWCGPSVNLECRSEMCCMRLAGNAGPKKSPSGHHRTTLSGYIFATKACINNRKKNLLNSDISPTRPHNMVNSGPLMAEIRSGVSGTPANFNGFRVLAALLHGTLVVGVS